MAGSTVIKNVGMIESCAHKCVCREMTVRAIFRGWQVIIRKSCADHTIMTGCTVAAYTVVIKNASGENAWGMAHTAILGGWHMVV